MGFLLSSIPRSSTTTRVVHLLASCCTTLQKVRPPLAQMATSLIETAPQVPQNLKPLPSRTTYILITAGATLVAMTIYLIARRIIHAFSLKPASNAARLSPVLPVDSGASSSFSVSPSATSASLPSPVDPPLSSPSTDSSPVEKAPSNPSSLPPSTTSAPLPPPVDPLLSSPSTNSPLSSSGQTSSTEKDSSPRNTIIADPQLVQIDSGAPSSVTVPSSSPASSSTTSAPPPSPVDLPLSSPSTESPLSPPEQAPSKIPSRPNSPPRDAALANPQPVQAIPLSSSPSPKLGTGTSVSPLLAPPSPPNIADVPAGHPSEPEKRAETSSPLPFSPAILPPSSSAASLPALAPLRFVSHSSDSPSNPENGSPPSGQVSPSSSPPPPPSMMENIRGAVNRVVSTGRGFERFMKYRIVQQQLEQAFRKEQLGLYTIASQDSKVARDIAEAWNNLVNALTRPTDFETADEQYKKTIEYLRKTIQLLLFAKEEVQQQFSRQLDCVLKLSYARFAEIALFTYCRQLVELATKRELPKDLSLNNFLPEFLSRSIDLDNPDTAHNMNVIARQAQRAKGTLGIGFDPLVRGGNVPYLHGMLIINAQSILIGRHGAPLSHDDPFGFVCTVVAGVAKYIPFLNQYISGNIVFNEPVINADYVGFLKEASRRREKILSVVLQDGQPKTMGNESPHVEARLTLDITHDNLYSIAVRMDGQFFERKDCPPEEPLEELKKRLKQQLLMPLTPKTADSNNPLPEDKFRTLEKIEHMKEQLEGTGCYLPEKLRRETQLAENFDTLLDEIQTIYFPGIRHISTLEQHQAFIVLSYVHMTLFICRRLNIHILEALCRDDKDRGNVFKTVLILHFLYLTGQINPETLTRLLVNGLAAPFIVQKNAIIESRRKLLERIIPFITAAFNTQPLPKTQVFGEEVKTADYKIFPGPTLFPDNSTAKNLEEYRAFLARLPTSIKSLQGNLIEEMASTWYENGEPQQEKILQQLSSTAQSLNIRIRETLQKPPSTATPLEQKAYYMKAAKDIVGYLSINMGAKENAWKVACAIQPRLSAKLQVHLSEIFDNRPLGYSIQLDETMSQNPESGIYLQDEIPSIKYLLFYKIADNTGKSIARLKASVTIPDHKTGQAQLEFSFL